MSLNDLILFPYIPKEIYDEYKFKKNTIVSDFKSLSKEINKLFSSSKSGDKLSQSILYDFYVSVNHPTVFKDNITGKRLEQRFSKLFALSTGDEIPKENPNINVLLSEEEVLLFDIDVQSLICSNYREKGDLFFYSSSFNNFYKISIKSLIPKNNEINFGAFEFQSTFKGIIGLEELHKIQERGRAIELKIGEETITGIGLGSSKQMGKVFDFIKKSNKLEEYLYRFQILVKGVYKDDFLIYIKNNEKFSLYLIKNEVFINFILDKVKSGFKGMRFEGNALRLSNIIDFLKLANLKIDEKIQGCISNSVEIEKLLIDSSSDKLKSLKNFIGFM